jgi:hypothetical protein
MRRAKIWRMFGLSDKFIEFPHDRSEHQYGDFAFLLTENWGSPGGVDLAIVRALPDILKISGYETKIWRMRRRRFQQFLAAKEGR